MRMCRCCRPSTESGRRSVTCAQPLSVTWPSAVDRRSCRLPARSTRWSKAGKIASTLRRSCPSSTRTPTCAVTGRRCVWAHGRGSGLHGGARARVDVPAADTDAPRTTFGLGLAPLVCRLGAASEGRSVQRPCCDQDRSCGGVSSRAAVGQRWERSADHDPAIDPSVRGAVGVGRWRTRRGTGARRGRGATAQGRTVGSSSPVLAPLSGAGLAARLHPRIGGDLPQDLPLMVVRAGQDAVPGVNTSIDHFVAAALARNLPVTVTNHATAPHSFDLLDDTETFREVIRQILAFLRFHLRA